MAVRLVAALASVALAAGLASCGGEDDERGTSTDTNPTAAPGGQVEPSDAFERGGSVLSGTQPSLTGEPVDLAGYRGKVVLVVNTASECGFAPQFEGLERLYDERKQQGFVVLGFPADDVVGQEPRSDEEIAEFCEANYGVSFPMFSKSNVVDEPVNPLFARLSQSLGEPSYNFNKYLLDRGGKPVERFDQTVEPEDPELTSAIDAQL
jgi:glutathione peroxidase